MIDITQFSIMTYLFVNFHYNIGVSSCETDLETKKVVVTADDSVTPEAMLEKLQKVRMINQIKINQHGIIITIDLSSRYDLQKCTCTDTILYYTMLTNFKKLPAFMILL